MMSSIKRFSAGATIGLVIAATYWGTTSYFEYPLTLTRGVLGCLVLGTICGLITLKWGYQVVEALLENLR
ncbi:hypothetical protein NIES4071_36620 [Calothrix sp. NIES-4071]|nr:hypothetical protein NIES4071_36620 [Calothrix sp. NIES-4071]BAZ57981.1 hypothetical protein NIES4105_36550 [Calothrix sp. NIES-4105]